MCGSNNKNYQNECFLRRDACKQQSEVLIVSEGDCPAGMYIYLMVPTHKHTQEEFWYQHTEHMRKQPCLDLKYSRGYTAICKHAYEIQQQQI